MVINLRFQLTQNIFERVIFFYLECILNSKFKICSLKLIQNEVMIIVTSHLC